MHIRIVLCLYMGILGLHAGAVPDPAPSAWVVVVAPAHHYAIVHRIEAALHAASNGAPPLIWIDPTKLHNHQILDDTHAAQDIRLVVTVGPSATRSTLKENPKFPVLAILLYKSTFEEILSNTPHRAPRRKITAIYLDQPFARSLRLASLLIPPAESTLCLGVVLGAPDKEINRQLNQEARRFNTRLNITDMLAYPTPIDAITQVLEGADALLALPDDRIYNSKTARGLLLTAYRYQVPVIGYSQTYVKMGALAAVSATPKQVAQQSSETILKILAHPEAPLPAPQLAAYFNVFVNDHVARLLGIPEARASVLQSQLEAMEGETPHA